MGKLTVTAVQKAKPRDRDYKLADGAGLYLYVLSSGGRSWRLDYRYGGKRKTLTLGRFPRVSLADARHLVIEAHSKLAQGVDPAIERKVLKATAYLNSNETFEAVAREWAEMHLADKSASHKTRSKALLENDLIPVLGGIPMRDLNAVLLLGALRKVESRSIDMAHRARALAGQILRYAVATGRAERDFTPDLRGALRSRRKSHYPAITDPKEFAKLMLAIDYYNGTMTVRNALKIAPLLMLRPGELRHMTWEHVNWEKAQLEFPVGYMKRKDAPHIVPLSRQALAILREQQRFNGRFPPVFPSGHGRRSFLSENGVRAALRNMGYANSVQTVHGFRASARTIMDEVLGERPDLLEAQLHHMVRDSTGRAYNRTSHLEARREMLQRWADWIDESKRNLNVSD
ncbi:tyrosine-type recombinase/integrase [Microbulbifer pacificus]|uniref:Integrase arm-type DNA-binding domain-containing protein n=1 Tax=Microbulbifer pacificus TaxID=407164 RepID=A0AAU0N0M6_9GAMM|nr:integrase arm-type DNA-binding domain-containing protein [Microbulbifer pacificus]WOX05971.1 integrase arm-type DNA-binding domain-containing protein [Microbulbifer pacificus]